MKKTTLIFWLSVLIPFITISQPFQQKTTSIGNVGMTLSNFGTIGQPNIRNNPSGNPSLEYPLNSGIEHLFEGGLWIGGMVNGQIRVSTASIDAPNGYYTGGSGFEFTALNSITERSTISSSQYFSGAAVSHQDFTTSFTDSNIVVPGTSIPITDHQYPFRAVVNLESYAWNFSFADFFVILNYQITNKSNNIWDSVYFGLWADLVIRNVNVTQDAGTAFFNKGGGGYLDTFKSLYVYEAASTADDYDYTQSYAAMQFLGIFWNNLFFHPSNSKLIKAAGYNPPEVNANFWNFKTFDGSQFGAPEDDIQRYNKMRKSLDFSGTSSVPALLAVPGNKTQLLSVGPVPVIKPGETVNFIIALVCAKQKVPATDNEQSRTQLYDHLNWAKRTFLGEDINENGKLDAGEDLNHNGILDRYILPEPPLKPTTKIIASNNKVDIYWDKTSINSIDPISKKKDFEGFKLYMSKPGDDLSLNLFNNARLIGSWDSAGNDIGFNNGFSAIQLPQPVKFEGDSTEYSFHYSVNGLLDGWQYLFILTAFDKGDKSLLIEPLESSFSDNAFGVFIGSKPDSADRLKAAVYPNPYSISAAWDGVGSRTRKIYFYNLPEKCEIRIYTLAGDILRTLYHDAATYKGDDIQWFSSYMGSVNNVFSGGEHAWDLLSESSQSVAMGLYIYSVKDLKTGKTEIGKFAIIK